MRIAIGSDHRGYNMKVKLAELLGELGHSVADEGPDSADSCDYPDVAAAVARRVSSGDSERGILICGTGIGMAITANKFPGTRAATCHDEVLLGESRLDNLVKIWLETEFEGGRHARRLEKIAAIERQHC
jgi:ribose 5-phosphate isomerase B